MIHQLNRNAFFLLGYLSSLVYALFHIGVVS